MKHTPTLNVSQSWHLDTHTHIRLGNMLNSFGKRKTIKTPIPVVSPQTAAPFIMESFTSILPRAICPRANIFTHTDMQKIYNV